MRGTLLIAGLRRQGVTLLGLVPGLVLVSIIAMAALFLAEHYGGPVMLYALLFGMALNSLAADAKARSGIVFSATSLLRVGVALLGAQLTLGAVAALGVPSVLLVLCAVAAALGGGWAIGRAFGLKSPHALLSAGSVAICGASAAMAISAVLPKDAETQRNLSLTVVGVTTLSTVAMVLYPVFAQLAGLGDTQAGLFLGATIHDVAQVVGAGYMISDEAGQTAALVKLMRVACLVPVVFFIALSVRGARKAAGEGQVPMVPGFLIGFVLLMGLNSLGLLPGAATQAMGQVSRLFLVIAVAGLGLRTSPREILRVGPLPVAAMICQTLFLAGFVFAGMVVLARF